MASYLGWTQINEFSMMGIPPEKSKYLMEYETIPDFSTWEGFGKLWEWAIEQEWWYEFWIEQEWSKPNLKNFANAIYKFLKEKEKV